MVANATSFLPSSVGRANSPPFHTRNRYGTLVTKPIRIDEKNFNFPLLISLPMLLLKMRKVNKACRKTPTGGKVQDKRNEFLILTLVLTLISIVHLQLTKCVTCSGYVRPPSPPFSLKSLGSDGAIYHLRHAWNCHHTSQITSAGWKEDLGGRVRLVGTRLHSTVSIRVSEIFI